MRCRYWKDIIIGGRLLFFSSYFKGRPLLEGGPLLEDLYRNSVGNSVALWLMYVYI